MPQTGNRTYGLGGAERKQRKRLERRRNKGLPSKARQRQVKDRNMALRLAQQESRL